MGRASWATLWLAGCWGGAEPVVPSAQVAPAEEVRGAAPRPPVDVSAPSLVVLVVLDTIRSSHLAVCGYGRPTSAFLEEMVGRGAALTCDAYAPATWTLPSHATFFSGLPVTDHDLLVKGLRLPPAVDTLAERFSEAGYQTLLVSANPVIKAETGLHQGFDRAVVARGLSAMRGDTLIDAATEALGRLDADKPLFVVLNVFDAHEPYPAVPAGVPWVPEHPRLSLQARNNDPDNPFFRYTTKKMDADEEAAFLAHAVDAYDWGVSRADRNAARLLKVLKSGGWGGNGLRLVVTSDHGENLGEHDLIGHDGPPWESVSRVPFLYLDTQAATQPALTAPFPAAALYELLLTGQVPDLGAPTSVSVQKGENDRRFRDAVAVWPAPGEKLMWMAGRKARFDLTGDPEAPLPVDDATPTPALDVLVAQLEAAKARLAGEKVDPEVVEMLERLGYAE